MTSQYRVLGGSLERIDEAPDEVFGTWKGKNFGGEEENIEHRTFNT